MGELGSIVGIISGLIAIFSFATGINSLTAIRRLRRAPDGSAPAESRPVIRRFLVALPLFVVSIAVTAAMGLSGSDTGGIMCLLLILCLLVVLSFHWLGIGRVLALRVYGPISTTAIAGMGLLFGSISRGEEGFGLAAGIAIGAGAWLITALTRRPNETPAGRTSARHTDEGTHSGANADCERIILEIASEQNGRLRVTDVALKSKLSLDEASEALKGLVRRKYCCEEKVESGAVTYRFPDLDAEWRQESHNNRLHANGGGPP